MAQAGIKATAGQEVRIAEINADAGADMGAFERLHERESADAFAVELKDAAHQYHGAVGIEWLDYVVSSREMVGQLLAECVQKFVAEHAPEDGTGQVKRVARRFGVVAAAGEIASLFAFTGWEVGEAEALKPRPRNTLHLGWIISVGAPTAVRSSVSWLKFLNTSSNSAQADTSNQRPKTV
jgi:putative DNA primase/helicase